MDSANTVETSKSVSYDQHVSTEQTHDPNTPEFGTLKKNDLEDFLLSERSHNGLLDSDYHKDTKDFLAPENLVDVDRPSDEDHSAQSNFEEFCGSKKLLKNTYDSLPTDVEFIPKSDTTESRSLLDFEPNEPTSQAEDEFESVSKNFISSIPPKFDDVEPLFEGKKSVPNENIFDVDSKEDSDSKFKEINDSPRSGTPDFLELEDDIKTFSTQFSEPKAERIPEISPKIEKISEISPKTEKIPEIPPKVDKQPESPLKPEKILENPIKSVDSHHVPEAVENKPVPGKKSEYHDKPEIGPREIFSKYGLDIWFNPERLNPTVEAFIYWRDPKLSGIVFVSGLVLLLAMAYYSLISVISNTGLVILAVALGFRVYKHVIQAVQKTDQAHPYSAYLDLDLQLPKDKVHELVDVALIHINACISELRRLFLVESLVESLKFGTVLWVLTYIGSWFNGLTLVIIAFVSLFTLPKIYENNKVQIDQNLALVHAKLEELTNKIKDSLPAVLRKKLPEKKE